MTEQHRDPRFGQLDALIDRGLGDVPGGKPKLRRRVVLFNTVFDYEAKAPFVPSGQSILGGIEIDTQNRFKCHECGAWHLNLSWHIKAHGMHARDYKMKHGLRINSRLRLKKGGWKIQNRRTGTSATLAKAREARQPRTQPLYELRNLRGKCSAQMAKRVLDIAVRIGHAPKNRELKEAGIHLQHLKNIFDVRTKREVMEMCRVPFATLPAHGPKKEISDGERQQLIDVLRNVEKSKGAVKAIHLKEPGLPGVEVYQRVFGTFSNALAMAGIGLSPRQSVMVERHRVAGRGIGLCDSAPTGLGSTIIP